MAEEAVAESIQPPASASGPLARLIRGLGAKGFWALGDQGVVSASDFLAGILIVRWLGKAQLGVYSVVLETVFWINSLQNALVLYPLTVQGAALDRRALRGPATASLLFTLMLAPVLGMSMGIGGALSAKRVGVAVTASVAMILWQLQETVRQALKTHLRFAACLPGDVIRHLGQVIGLWVLHKARHLDVATAFDAIAASSILATIVQAGQVGLARVTRTHLLSLARQFWLLGRWMLSASLLSSSTSVAFLWVLQYFHGNDQAGTNGAVVQPLKLTIPVSLGLASVMTPSVARTMKQFGAAAAKPVARQILLMGAILLSPYFLFVVVFPRVSLHLFLGHRYLDYLDATHLVQLYALNFAIAFFQVLLGAWLGGLGQSRLLFVTQIIKTAVGLLFSLPLAAYWGVEGVIVGNMVVLTVEAICYAIFINGVNVGRFGPPPGEEPLVVVETTS